MPADAGIARSRRASTALLGRSTVRATAMSTDVDRQLRALVQ
jgi:hypothetical protein